MNKQFDEAVAAVVPSDGAARRLRSSIVAVFRDVQLQGATVLDVGGGAGLHSLYAALNGAAKVICLEPGAQGAMAEYSQPSGVRTNDVLGASVQVLPLTIQEFDPGMERFDVILLHNSVNHLDEQACMKLPDDVGSARSYKVIFEKLSSIAKDGALIIITDSSSKNFFALVPLRNPFAPSIEWEKHHRPSVWIALLESTGFTNVGTYWIVPQRLGSIGQQLFGNGPCTFFLSSYFRLTASRTTGRQTDDGFEN